MNFLLYRAGQIDAITRHQSEYMWKKLSALGWRTHEPQETEFPYEEPTVFPGLLKLHSEDLEYDWNTLRALLSTTSATCSAYTAATSPRGGRGCTS